MSAASPTHITPLRIDKVRAESFGGLTGVQLDLGSAGTTAATNLVVVHGPNESGKTSLATLLAWLLVGPTDDQAASERFGAPDSLLDGKLEGYLGTEDLRIDGTYRLLKRGLPNTNAVKVIKGSDTLNLDQWRNVLGGIDAKVMTAVYRLWGADLHSNEDVMAEISQLALAGLPGNRRMAEVISGLQEATKDAVSSNAAAATSWHKSLKAADELKAEIRSIQNSAAEHRQGEQRLAQIDAEIAELHATQTELRGHERRLETLAAVAEDRARLGELRSRLADLEIPPQEWVEVLAVIDEIDTEVATIDQLGTQIEHAQSVIARSAAALGLTDTEAQGLRVTFEVETTLRLDAGTAAERRRTLSAREQDLTTAQQQREDAARTAVAARETAGASAADLGELSTGPTRLGPAEFSAIADALQDWRTAEDQAAAFTAEFEGHQPLLAGAEERVRAANAAWERWGTSLSPTAWQARSSGSAGRSAAPVWVAPAALGVSLLAVTGLPRWPAVAVVAVMVAVVAAATVLGSRRAGNHAEPAEMGSDAAAVREAEANLREVAAESRRREAAAELRAQKVAERRRELLALLEGRPIAVGSTAEATGRTVEALRAALDAAQTQDAADRDLRVAEDRVSAARDELSKIEESLAALLRDAGLPERLTWEIVEPVIARFRELCTEMGELTRLRTTRDGHASRLAELLSPLGDLARTSSSTALLAEGRRLQQISIERDQLEAEANELDRGIERRLGQDHQARALAEESIDRPEIETQLESTQAQIRALAEQIGDLQQERGRLRERLDTLAATERLTGLRVRIGTLEETATERLCDGAVSSLAAALIRRAVAERRRTHQPQLIARASEMLRSVAPQWDQLILDPDDHGAGQLSLLAPGGLELNAHRLSTGARALTLLALRLANAELDAERRRVRFPIICDDPLVHFDDDRATAVMPLLAQAASVGHQVILFTCHNRTLEAAQEVGARMVSLTGN